MSRIKAVGFDFDGTLILSEKAKLKIVEDVFYKKFKVKKGIGIAYGKLRGKFNKEEKIIRLLRKTLKREPKNKEIKEISNLLTKGYKYEMATCPLVQCTNVLGELKKQVKFMFLLSLEERSNVVAIAKHCGVSKYFDEILGGPKSKVANFKHLVAKHHLKPGEVVYVGDSKGDITESKKFGFKAIGIQKKFSYRHLLKKLGADFTFSKLCNIPYKHVVHSHFYKK